MLRILKCDEFYGRRCGFPPARERRENEKALYNRREMIDDGPGVRGLGRVS